MHSQHVFAADALAKP